jgi:hypothetical protein
VVWRVQKISPLYLGVVSFLEGEHPRKNHMIAVAGAGLNLPLYALFLRWQSLQIDSLLFDWELREELNNKQQGMILVTAQVCQGFSPLLV